MKRIALVITELHPGGAEKCCVELAVYLRQQGWDVAVFQLWPEPPKHKRLLTDQLDRHGIPWSSGGAVKAWDFVAVTCWLRRQLREYAPDVVQSFLFHGNLASALAVRGLSCQFFGGARVRQPEWWRQRLQRWAAGQMQQLVCVSQAVERHCRQQERIPQSKLLTIPNGIQIPDATRAAATQPTTFLNHFSAASPSPPPAEMMSSAEVAEQTILRQRLGREFPGLLFVGRLTPQKGIVALLEQSDALLNQLPEHHLICLGDGPCRGILEQLQHASPHRQRIHLPGWSPQPLDWMRGCEMLLLPAVYEGMPNVVLEAMGVGKPVVAFDVEGIDELLGRAAPGSIQRVPAGDTPGFLRTIIEIASNSTLATELGKLNQSRVEQHFRLIDQLKKYSELYQSPKP